MADIHRGLAENIKSLRDERGWSVYRLAKESDVSRMQIGRIESLECSPTLDVLERIASGFGVRVDALLYGDEGEEIEG